MTDLHEQRYRAVAARDARFDGVFYTAVRTTGIYCRPSCPAVTPRLANVEFHVTAAAAQDAGYRACRRCRPDTVPGSPEWDVRADVVGRAMRLIGDGVVEREGVAGLASRLGYSTRHLTRLLTDELGAGPLALARSGRTQTARLLVETTAMPMADVAFAAGFASVRQFNDSMSAAYGMTPTELRRRGRPAVDASGTLSVRLAVRQPFAAGPLLEFLADHVVAGLETVEGRTYARTARLPHGPGVLALTIADDHVRCDLELTDLRDTAVAVGRARRLLDLDADPVAIDEVLGADPGLAPHVASEPGLRVPGSLDGFETAVRTIVGQQVSLAGAATVIGRLLAAHGEPVDLPLARRYGLTHAFPEPAVVAKVPEESLAMPRSRARAVAALGHAVDAGDVALDPGADRDEARTRLLALPGVGPWTADYVLMRALSHPDVLLTTDLVMRRELTRRGLTPSDTDRWRPWRSYAGMHLWRAATAPVPERIPS